MPTREELIHSHIQLMTAIQDESRKFQEFYVWLEKYMPSAFFEELKQEQVMLVTHNLMGFHVQEFFSRIHLKNAAIFITLDSADADVKVLKYYSMYGIKNYRAFVSEKPFPAEGNTQCLRVAVVHFTEFEDCSHEKEPLDPDVVSELRTLVNERNPNVGDEEFNKLISGMNNRFLRSLPTERLILALDMFFRAQTRDHCQYEVRYNEDWEEKDLPSMQIVLAWRNTPKHNFLYRLARVVHRHGLIMRKVNAAYINPYDSKGILIMSLGLHGHDGKAVWDVADIPDFLKELVMMKYFDDLDPIDDILVTPNIITGNQGNLLRAMMNFIHQALLNVDVNLYTYENVEEALCRHPELTAQICQMFEYKFHPDNQDLTKYRKERDEFKVQLEKLDTGREVNDTRRRNVLTQALNFIEFTFKTNNYRNNKTALSFRIDPAYLDNIPFEREKVFPELPHAIFFIKGMHFFGFHIRFKELSRGGLRTIFPEKMEHMIVERNNVFTECYFLAYTQQKKNKDIPEGGAKGTIFLKPYQRLQTEAEILEKELISAGFDENETQSRIDSFLKEQKVEYLYQTQRCFVNSMLTIINSDEKGKLRAKHVVHYWKKPEYIYLGPDENMHNSMIEWIANHSENYKYKPAAAFISSKPDVGINHKEWGVTSLGVNVYMHEVIKYLGIDPAIDSFTVKISGGPDGDVAGNQIKNLHRFYRDTAKLVALVDVSGTIYDPEGLDLDEMMKLFEDCKPIKFYPPEKLSEGGLLLDRFTKRDMNAYVQQTLCWRKKDGKVVEDWLSGNDMNHLFRFNVHQAKADIFIPAGGRPRTLNDSNFTEFLDSDGKPTSKAIVEGANLYLTPWARRELEDLGVIIIKDSSANKGGVITSSFEVLYGLVLSKKEIFEKKTQLVEEILNILKSCALKEATLMLNTHKKTGMYLTDISEKISEKINKYTYLLLDHLEKVELSKDPNNPMIKCFLNYCPPILSNEYRDRLLKEVPDHHKKAIIASRVASQLVYNNGIDWTPSIVDVLPLIWQDEDLLI
jgi:glutamate dehydrogenase